MAKKRQTFKADQRGALQALRAVADELKLLPGTAPTAEQFREVAPRVAPGWSVHYVTLAYGRWREATRALKEGRGPERRLHFGRLPHSADPAAKALRALRLWVGSSPSSHTIRSYETFAESYNQTLGQEDEPLPMATAIYNALNLNFDEAVRVAADEVSLKDARPYQRKRAPSAYEDREGPYGLIGPSVVCEVCEVSLAHLNNVLRKRQDFPTASLVLGDIHLRRREDVEAFARGEQVTPRTFNELRHEYATVSEVAAETGLDVSTVRVVKWLPEPEVVASGRRGYRRSEILDALQKRRSGEA